MYSKQEINLSRPNLGHLSILESCHRFVPKVSFLRKKLRRRGPEWKALQIYAKYVLYIMCMRVSWPPSLPVVSYYLRTFRIANICSRILAYLPRTCEHLLAYSRVFAAPRAFGRACGSGNAAGMRHAAGMWVLNGMSGARS